jgi:hypothetical protein
MFAISMGEVLAEDAVISINSPSEWEVKDWSAEFAISRMFSRRSVKGSIASLQIVVMPSIGA